MKRAEIRHAVKLALADNGYSEGWYGWQGASLHVFDRDRITADLSGRRIAKIHLPAGKTSKKRLIEKLSILPVAGAPRTLHINVTGARDDQLRQLCIEDAIRDAR